MLNGRCKRARKGKVVNLCTSLRKISGDFEDSGVVAALMRTFGKIAAEFGRCDLPEWAFAPSLALVLGTEYERGYSGPPEMMSAAAAALAKLHDMEARILAVLGRPLQRQGAAGTAPSASLHPVATARLMLGACCEAFCELEAGRVVPKGFRSSKLAVNIELAQIYKDSCLVSIWTSAHASFVSELLSFGMCSSPPSIHTVACEPAEFDFVDLFARRFDPKCCASKESAALLGLMTRSLVAGARGWDSASSKAVEDNAGVKQVVSNAMLLQLIGMNCCIHPAQRLHWTQRLALTAVLNLENVNTIVTAVCEVGVAMKELFRRLVANTTGSDLASNAALRHLDSPCGKLEHNAVSLAPEGLEYSCTAFCVAGHKALAAAAQARAAGASGADRAPSISSVVAASLAVSFTEKGAKAAPSADGLGPLQWEALYMGKKTQAVFRTLLPATTPAAMVFSSAFKANFLPFWVHSWTHGVRAVRLDRTQHEAINGMSSAVKLTILLPESEQLQVQRLAVGHPSAGILTLEETAALLGGTARATAGPAASFKTALDATSALAAYGGHTAARLLHFCRAAHVSESLLVYDLGERTRELQKRALVKRTLVDEFYSDAFDGDLDRMMSRVPFHATHLCACMECRRVCNACADDKGQAKYLFNEIGTTSSMASLDVDTGKVVLRCARRTSASVKAAVVAEGEISGASIENKPLKLDDIGAAISADASSDMRDEGASARARRDAKTAMEQRASSMPCGEEDILTMSVVGKAVRIFGQWYALCSYCAAFCCFGPVNRFKGEICCLRCDAKMLNRHVDVALLEPKKAPRCKFCGKVDPMRAGARWRICRAPNDTSGVNATLPPPLRTLAFCRVHYKPWIPSCLEVMPTQVILSHILYGARPSYDAEIYGTQAKKQGRRQSATLKQHQAHALKNAGRGGRGRGGAGRARGKTGRSTGPAQPAQPAQPRASEPRAAKRKRSASADSGAALPRGAARPRAG